MQYTSNFNFNLPEGTDLWNYLTQTNPNFTALDTLLKSIQDGTVTTATEVTSGTAHAVTRTLPDANVIRFTATGVWTLGDTMTIDGTPVTVVKPNGTSLQTGDYIIGSEVLGILRATQFTVYVGGASSLDASDVTFDNDNTHTWLTGTDVEDALKETATEIDTINSNLASLPKKVASVTTDGTQTLTTILNALFNSITVHTDRCYQLTIKKATAFEVFHHATVTSSFIRLFRVHIEPNEVDFFSMELKSSGSLALGAVKSVTSTTDSGSSVRPSGEIYSLYETTLP